MEPRIETESSYPLFKGLTRLPTWGGVPTAPLMVMTIVIVMISMWTSPWCLLLWLPVFGIMRIITLTDDKAFRIIGLLYETKLRNKNKLTWRASSYSPIRYPKKRFEE